MVLRDQVFGRQWQWGGLVQTLDLLWELTLRDLRMRYKRSVLGIIWALLNPLAQIVIFSFLFVHVMPLGVQNYTTFVFCGVLAWSWFSSAVIGAAGSVVGNPELVRRPGFPVAVLPVLSVTSNAVHFLIALPILLPLALIDGGKIGVSLFALPIVILIQFLLTMACSIPVAQFNVRFRDMQHLISLVLMAAFYMTPIFYSAEQVPASLRILYDLNPVAILLDAYRSIFVAGEWPAPMPLLGVTVLSVALLVVAYRSFDRATSHFVEEL